MARILVLGGAGEMGSVAVRDLVERTDHEVLIADLRPDAAEAVADELDSPRVSMRAVDVEDDRSLREAMAGVDTVLNATYMRWNVRVTRVAIEAGVHLVDLGAYIADTAEQLAMDEQAREAGCRIVPGCGVAPGLTSVLAAHGARQLDQVESIGIYSYITHPITTSPGIVYTRFDASRGVSLAYRDGRLEEHPSFGEEEAVEFQPPYGTQLVHLVPHPSRSPCRSTSTCRTSCSRSATPKRTHACSGRCSSWAWTARIRSRSQEPRSSRGTSSRPSSFAEGSRGEDRERQACHRGRNLREGANDACV